MGYLGEQKKSEINFEEMNKIISVNFVNFFKYKRILKSGKMDLFGSFSGRGETVFLWMGSASGGQNSCIGIFMFGASRFCNNYT